MSTATVSRVEIQALTHAAELLCPWWADCTPDEQALVVRDMDRACNGDGLAVDVADSIGELFAEHDAPDDLLAELLRQLKARGICSAPVVRGIDAFLTIIVRANAKEAA